MTLQSENASVSKSLAHKSVSSLFDAHQLRTNLAKPDGTGMLVRAAMMAVCTGCIGSL